MTYHVFGDSHKFLFPKTDGWIHHEVTGPGGSLTAYNLLKPNSSTESWRKLLEVVDHMGSHDWLIMSAGEVDCRFHVYYQAHKQGLPVETIILNTVRRYGAALLALKILVNRKLIVLGIPPAGNEPSNVNYPPPCPLEVRLGIYRNFNLYMREFCRLNFIQYLDVYSVGADEKGFFKEGWGEETPPASPVHLKYDLIQPIVLEMLK